MFDDLGHVNVAQMRGGGGGVTRVVNSCLRMCERNYADARFIVPTQVPLLGPSLAPGPAGY